jgi:hypothetical protein
MELSDEIKSSIDDFILWYSKEVNPYHYLELRIIEVRPTPPSLEYRIDFHNSVDNGMLVIDDVYYNYDWYVDFYYLGFCYYKNYWIIIKVKDGVTNAHNRFIKRSSWPFVMRFMLYRHDGFIPPAGTSVNSGLNYGVKENVFTRYPQIIWE